MIGVGALLTILMVRESMGLAAGAGLAGGLAAGVLGYRFYRRCYPAKGPEVYCLRCGAVLPSTARHCKVCGSASWSMKN